MSTYFWFLILTPLIASSYDVHVNQPSTHPSPDGSQSAPYTSLEQAITDSVWSNGTLKQLNTTFRVHSGTQFVFEEPVSLTTAPDSSFSIIYEPALADSDIDCSNLPILVFEDSSSTPAISFQPNDWNTELPFPSAQPKAKLFRLQGFRISHVQIMDDNKTMLDLHNIEAIDIKHLCITDDESSMQAEQRTKKSISSIITHISEVSIDSIIQKTLHPLQIIIEEVETSATVSNISLILSQTVSETVLDYVALKIMNTNADTLSGIAAIDRMTLQCPISELDTEGTSVISTQIAIGNVLSTNISNFTIIPCELLIEDTVVKIYNSQSVCVEHLIIADISLSVVESDSLRAASFLTIDEFKAIELNDIQLRNLSLHYRPAEELDIEGNFMRLATQKSGPEFLVRGFEIVRCNLHSPFTLLHIDALDPISNLSYDDFTIEESHLEISRLFRFVTPAAGVHTPDTASWKFLRNWAIRNNTFIFCYLIVLETDERDQILNTFDNDLYAFVDMQIVDNYFGYDEGENSDCMLEVNGALISWESLIFERNYFDIHDVILPRSVPSNMMFVNSSISSNYISYGDFVRDELIISYSIYGSIDEDVFLVPPDQIYQYRLTKGTFLQNCIVNDNIFADQSNLLLVAQAYVIITNSTFLRNMYVDSTDHLVDSSKFLGLPLDYYETEGYVRNLPAEQKMFERHSYLMSVLNKQTVGSLDIPEHHFYIYLVENCYFEDHSMVNKGFIFRYSMSETTNSGYNFYGNTFRNMHFSSDDYVNLIVHRDTSYFRFENNLIDNISGNGVIIEGKDFREDMTNIYKSNVFQRGSGIGLMTIRTFDLGTAIFHNNLIVDFRINTTVIEFAVENLHNNFYYSKNTLSNVWIYSHITKIKQVNFLQLQVSQAFSNSEVVVSDSTFKHTGMTKDNSFIRGAFKNSYLFLSTGGTRLTLSKLIFHNVSVYYEDSLIVASGRDVAMEDSRFTDLLINEPKGLLLLTYRVFSVRGCYFQNINGDKATDGPLFFLEPSAGNELLTIRVMNNTFKNIWAPQGAILIVRKSRLDFEMVGNYIENIVSKQSGAIIVEDSAFTRFEVKDTRVQLDINDRSLRNYDSTTFYLYNCSFSNEASNELALIDQITVIIRSFHKGYFVTVTECPLLPLKISSYNSSSLLQVSDARLLMGVAPNLLFTKFGLASAVKSNLSLDHVTVSDQQLTDTSIIQLLCDENQGRSTLIIKNSKFRSLSFETLWTQSLAQPITPRSVIYLPASESFCPHSIQIINSTFESIVSDYKGAVIDDNQQSGTNSDNQQTIQIQNSTFSNNNAIFGGAIYSQGSHAETKLQIIGSRFTSNHASEQGGALWLNGVDLHLKDCIFDSNFAALSGSAIYTELSSGITTSMLNKNAFLHTTDPKSQVSRGPNFLYVQKLDHTHPIELFQYSSQEFSFANATSHTFQDLHLNITLVYIDTNGLVHRVQDNSEVANIKIVFTLKDKNLTANTFLCNNAECSLRGMDVELQGAAGDVIPMTFQYSSARYKYTIASSVLLRNCIPGEVFDSQRQVCSRCRRGEYSIDPEMDCQPCP